VISADGSRVSFVSNASDLVPVDSNRDYDVFLRDLPDGPTRLISINAAGTDSSVFGGGNAYLTPNGHFVAFESLSYDLLPETDQNGRQDVFLRDVDAGVTRLVSADPAGNPAGDSELSPPFHSPAGLQVASGDGRFVVFRSSMQNLVSGVSYPCGYSPCDQVYLRDLQAGTTRLLSATPAGDVAGNQGTELDSFTQISGDGRVAVFESPASNLSRQPDTNNADDVFSVGAPLPLPIAAVPTLGGAGLALLALLIAGMGLRALRH
jgi:Tol biopolymer transport system component